MKNIGGGFIYKKKLADFLILFYFLSKAKRFSDEAPKPGIAI